MNWCRACDDVADLVLEPKRLLVGDEQPSRYGSLVDLITCIVAPDTWNEVGGAGIAVAYDPWGMLSWTRLGRSTRRWSHCWLHFARRQVIASAKPGESDLPPVPVIPEQQAAATQRSIRRSTR